LDSQHCEERVWCFGVEKEHLHYRLIPEIVFEHDTCICLLYCTPHPRPRYSIGAVPTSGRLELRALILGGTKRRTNISLKCRALKLLKLRSFSLLTEVIRWSFCHRPLFSASQPPRPFPLSRLNFTWAQLPPFIPSLPPTTLQPAPIALLVL